MIQPPFKSLISLLRPLLVVATVGCLQLGCAPDAASKPDYERPLVPGGVALRPAPQGSVPNLEQAWRQRDAGLLDAIERSLAWFEMPSSRRSFPYATSDREISHEEARRSLSRFRDVLEGATSSDDFRRQVLDEFRIYESIGWDGGGTVLFTGYYAPDFNASETRTERFAHPLHRRPADLITDPRDGTPIGRRMPDGSIERYPTRAEIMSTGLHDGNELAWLESPLDVYVVQVNGSARLNLPDGRRSFVGYAGKTDRPYSGLGVRLVETGHIPKGGLSLPAIYELHESRPEVVEEAMLANENFVYFQSYDGAEWPSGSLGFKVNPKASLATDKDVYPPGCVCLVDTSGVTVSGTSTPFLRFMVDHDTGGGIRAPGRADIYMGEGDDAETLAGGQYAEGHLFYLFLR
ncbi:MAG: MltA domain-containing protein [Phycisphaerales bacterium]|nr:MltA domain-containing protein [Phycisphaerales bacterium]